MKDSFQSHFDRARSKKGEVARWNINHREIAKPQDYIIPVIPKPGVFSPDSWGINF